MPQARSQFRFGAALTSACLVLALTLAPTASPQSGVTDMLIVLKNQPARQILDSIASTSGTPRKLAEDDFRRLSGQAGVPHQMKAAAAQRLLTQVYAQTRQASAEIKAAIAPEQDILAGRLTGLGATAIRHYSALNMLEAQIPEAALAAVQQDPAVAEVIPVGANQKLLDDIEQGLTDPTNVMLASIENRASADPAFLRLIDRIIDDRDALVTAATDWGAFNTVTGSPDTALGSFGHLAVKAAGLNGGEPNLFSDSVSAAQPFRLYTGRGQGPFQSTLVWDRHFSDGLQPSLRNLDLFLYNNSDGAQLASSESPDKNVEQAPFNDAGEFVVKVKLQPAQDGSPAEEAYALALSEQGFTVAQGPQLSVKCPSDCTVSNAGDLPAYNVTATAQGEDYNLGTIQPSSSASFTPRAAAVNTTVTSRSFGEVFSSSASAPDPCGGKWTVSPTFYNFPASGGGQSFTVTPPASNCYWKPDPVLGPFYTAFPSPTGVTVQVSPNTTSSPRSGYVVILASIYLPYATIPSFVNVASLGFSQGGGTTGKMFDVDVTLVYDPPLKPTDPLPTATVTFTDKDGNSAGTVPVDKNGKATTKLDDTKAPYKATLTIVGKWVIDGANPVEKIGGQNPHVAFTVHQHGIFINNKTPVTADSQVYKDLVKQLGADGKAILDAMIQGKKVYDYANQQLLINEVTFRFYLIKAARDLAAATPGFGPNATAIKGLPSWTEVDNLAYTTVTNQPGITSGIVNQRGVKPAQAIRDLFTANKNGGIRFDCVNAQNAVFYKAQLDYVGEAAFNLGYAGGVEISFRRWNGVYDTDKSADMIPGDGKAFDNPDADVDKPQWKHENALYLGGDSFYGHDLGVVTEAQMLHDLAGAASGKKTAKLLTINYHRWGVPPQVPFKP